MDPYTGLVLYTGTIFCFGLAVGVGLSAFIGTILVHALRGKGAPE